MYKSISRESDISHVLSLAELFYSPALQNLGYSLAVTIQTFLYTLTFRYNSANIGTK